MAGKFRFAAPPASIPCAPPANLGVRSDDLLARRAGREQRIAKLEKALDGTLQVVSKVGA